MMTATERLSEAGAVLDGLLFVPGVYEHETVYLAAEDGAAIGDVIGELDFDEEKLVWRARMAGDEAWIPMRCRAEARAFIAGWHRNAVALLPAWARQQQDALAE